MRSIRWNGEAWYVDNRSIVARLLGWLVWPGGWRRPVVQTHDVPLADGSRRRLRDNAHAWTVTVPWSQRWFGLRELSPLSLFGHRFTWFGWGWQLRLPDRSWLVYVRRGGRLYRSVDGTPSGAFVWYRGARAEDLGDD